MEIAEGKDLYKAYFVDHTMSLEGDDKHDLGEDMEVYAYSDGSHYRENLIVDHREKKAYYLMDGFHWNHFSTDDINKESIKDLSQDAKDNAYSLNIFYPYSVGRFKNGVAEVDWQLIPDGMYFMDSDGYGMTDDVETPLYAMIDRHLNVLVKFRFINKNYDILKKMRAEAEKKVALESASLNINRPEPYDIPKGVLDGPPPIPKNRRDDHNDHAKIYGPPPPRPEERQRVKRDKAEDPLPSEHKPREQSVVYGPPPIIKNKGCLTTIIAVIITTILTFIVSCVGSTGKNSNLGPSKGNMSVEYSDSLQPTAYGPPRIDTMGDDWEDNN